LGTSTALARVSISARLAPVALTVAFALGANAALVFVGTSPAHASGVLYCVGPGSGDPASGCANPNHQDFTDISQALGVAGDGDLINVAAGTYPSITVAHSVTITGGYPGGVGGYCCSPSSTGSTISGTGGPAITVEAGSPTVIYINESDGVEVTGGALVVSGDGTSQGNFDIASGAQVNFVNGTRTLADGTSFTGAGYGRAAGASVVVGGAVNAANFEIASGPFATPALTGTGVLTATGNLLWTGGDIGGTGSINVANGATLTISGTILRVQRQNTINNSGTTLVTGSFGFEQSDNATFNNLAGALFDNQADALVGGFANESGSRTFNNDGIFRKSGGTGTTEVDADFTGSGTVDAESGNISFGNYGAVFVSSTNTTIGPGATVTYLNANDTLNDGATITGAGLAIVSGTLTTNGTTSAANLRLTNANNLNTNGTLTIQQSFDWDGGNLGGTGSIAIANGATMTFEPTGTLVHRSSTINNSGVASVQGNYYQSDNAVFNNLAGGTFDIQSDVGVGLFAFESGSRTITNAGTFKKSAGTGTSSVQATFTNTGTVQALSGTLSFTDAYTQNSGSTVLNGGALATNSTIDLEGGTLSGNGTVTGGVTNNATVSPGFSPGAITITGSYTQNAGGTLDEELGGLTPGTQFDQLSVNGAATLGGTLTLSLVNGYEPSVGDSLAIINAGSTSGAFATVNQPSGLSGGATFSVTTNATNVTLTFQGPPTATPTVTSTATPTGTPTATSTASSTNTPTSTSTPHATRTPRPTQTPTETRTPRPTRTPTVTRTPTRTRRPTFTPTIPADGAPDDGSSLDPGDPGATSIDTPAPDDQAGVSGW
jgi:hypothetical protein